MKYLLMLKMMLVVVTALAQQKPAQKQEETSSANLTAKYDGGDIILNYKPVLDVKIDSVTISVIRKGQDGTIAIRTNKKISATITYQFADTTIRKKPGTYLYQISANVADRAVATADVWAFAYPDDAKPLATMLNVNNLKGTNNNVVKWRLENAFLLSSLQLKRSRSKDGNYQKVADLDPKDSLFVDKVHDANEPFYYRLDMVANNSQTVYQSVSVFVIPNFVIVPNAVLGIKAVQKNNAIEVTWQNNDEFARGYYVKKRVGNAGDFMATSAIITKNKLGNYIWKDTLSALQPKEMYQYVVVAESNSFNQSKHSDTATVAFQAIAKVLVPPTDLRIVTANDTTYHLVWTVDSLHSNEVAAYQLYYSAKGTNNFKALNNGLVTSRSNSIIIPKPKDGDTYYVKAINGDKQSAPSATYTHHNAFQKEFGPKYLKAALIDGLLNIKWLKDEEVKFRAFKLYRWNGKSFALIEQIAADKDSIATKNYLAGELNMYKLTTVNLHGEESNGSKVLQVN